MSKQLHTALTSILAMPYFKNDASRSGKTFNGHEAAISNRLIETGFTQVDKPTVPSLKKDVLNEWISSGLEPVNFLLEKTDKEYKRKSLMHRVKRFKDMPLGSFICQPCGSHSFPDFLLRDFDGRFIAIEAKSISKKAEDETDNAATTGSPMWNDNLPKHGAIYIYSNETVNETTFAMGENLISQESINLSTEMINAMIKVGESYEPKFAEADIGYGFMTWFRQQHFQVGGAGKTDWFKHKLRANSEKSVLKFALGK